MGDTPLHGGASSGFNSIIEYLAGRGANVDVENKKGQTPLGMAVGAVGGMMVSSRPETAAVLRRLGAKSAAGAAIGDIVVKTENEK